jgi:hypothetical protein
LVDASIDEEVPATRRHLGLPVSILLVRAVPVAKTADP